MDYIDQVAEGMGQEEEDLEVRVNSLRIDVMEERAFGTEDMDAVMRIREIDARVEVLDARMAWRKRNLEMIKKIREELRDRIGAMDLMREKVEEDIKFLGLKNGERQW